MRRGQTATAIGLAVAALAFAGCGGDGDESAATDDTETTASATVPETGLVLKGSVGPGFEISLSTEDGAAVETLAAGSYTLIVEDKSAAHNFHLTGEGVAVSTDVSGQGMETFDVDLTSGTYTFVCDPHASSMNGSVEISG